MAKKEPVNLSVQIILTIIPFGCLYTFYRVEKLKWTLLVFYPLIFMSLAVQLYFPYEADGNIFIDDEDHVKKFHMIAKITDLLLVAIFIYLIIKWSRQWNHDISFSGVGNKSFQK